MANEPKLKAIRIKTPPSILNYPKLRAIYLKASTPTAIINTGTLNGYDHTLKGYFKLDADLVAGNSGSYVGSPTLGVAAPTQLQFTTTGITLNGSNQYISASLTRPASYGTLFNTYIISAWIKTSSATDQYIYVENLNGTATNQQSFFWVNSSGYLNMLHYNNAQSNSPATSSVTVNDGNWHHVLGMVNGQTMKVFIDGIERGSATSGSALANNSRNFAYIGRRSQGNYFNGSLCDVRIFNYIPGSDEISALANGQYSTGSDVIDGWLEKGLISYWKLNETSGTTALDSSISSVGNPTLGVTSSPYLLFDSTAITFNGSTQYASLGTCVGLGTRLTGIITFSFWIKSTSTSLQDIFGSVTTSATGLRIILNANSNLNYSSGLLAVWMRDDGGRSRTTAITFGGGLNDGQWHHVAIVVYPSASALIFVDWVQKIVSTNTSGGSSMVNPADFAHPVLIGAYNNGGTPTSFCACSLDDFRIYFREFDSGNIGELAGGYPPQGALLN